MLNLKMIFKDTLPSGNKIKDTLVIPVKVVEASRVSQGVEVLSFPVSL